MGSLKLENISKSFNEVNVFSNIDLDVHDGEFVVFIGPSGCGKSTLLRIIAGLETATKGRVLINGEVVNHKPPSQRGIAMVFQTYALYPHLTVKDNMGLGLKQARYSKQDIEERVMRASAMLSLEKLLQRRPAELSGGQRQRVAIGRAIVRKPQLFLFDEPLSNLDATLRIQTRLEIARLHRELDASMIYVTHDQTEAMTLADKIVILNDGKIQQVGAPMELYNNPANRFVAGFIGTPHMNFIDAESMGYHHKGTVGVRPEHCLLRDPKKGGLKGTVSHVENLGADTNVYLDCEEKGRVTVRLFGAHSITIGDVHTVSYDENHLYHFDDQGGRLPSS